MCDDHAVPIVVDNGTHMCKAGYAGDDSPRAVFPSIVGVPPKLPHIVCWQHRDTYVGDEATPSRDILNPPLPPLQGGLITNWDSMEKIFFHTFYNELRVAPENHPILLSEIPLNPKYNREKMTQIMFETFRCPSLYVCNSAVISLYASGRVTGLVLESGHDVTHAVPVYEGYAIPTATTKLSFGGNNLTRYFWEMMNRRLQGTSAFIGKDSACQMKEKYCFVADEPKDVMKSPSSIPEIEHELPDGKKITIGNERLTCPEALFQPSCLSIEPIGIHHAIYKSILMNDSDIRNDLMANVVLSGGNTLFEGLPARLEREIRAMESVNNSTIKVTANTYRKYQAWIGGSILASSAAFSPCWISKQEYEESGEVIINWKCF